MSDDEQVWEQAESNCKANLLAPNLYVIKTRSSFQARASFF
jgi:hypothetical protein